MALIMDIIMGGITLGALEEAMDGGTTLTGIHSILHFIGTKVFMVGFLSIAIIMVLFTGGMVLTITDTDT